MPIPTKEHPVHISVKDDMLEGNLTLPEGAKGIVLFAHGSGSSRMSPRNQFVAQILSDAKFATLLFDLLTTEEEIIDDLTGEYRFDIELLANRLISVTDWVAENQETKELNIGYFGASTGAAAALLAAADRPKNVKAIVSRGGRPDLAKEGLRSVQAPTLLIVGERDDTVVQLNEWALQSLSCTKELLIIPGATHLFEEPGKLEKVADAAKGWFKSYLGQ